VRSWKLEDAKNRFSELVRRALSSGPQRVTRNGHDAVVVLSAEEYDRLTAPASVVEFMRASPLAEALRHGEIDLSRASDTGRDPVF
jgi:prevent-host-death family protein